jgi:hypothetical protein
LFGVGDGFPGGVVVVAEVFSAEAGAAAAVAFGEDVGALILFGGWCGVLHGWGSLSRQMCAKSSKEKTCVRTSPVPGLGVKCEGPAVAGPFLFYYYFYFKGLSETKYQFWADLFLACKGCGLLGFRVLISEFGGFWGLTCNFWAENAERFLVCDKNT